MFACTKRKDPTPGNFGKVNSKIQYSSVAHNKNSVKKNSDTIYTQFGDYITSITPSVFRAKFHTIRYQDNYSGQSSIELIVNELPANDPLRYANFSDNSSVTMVPTFWGDLRCSDDNSSCYFANATQLLYFYFRLQYFIQEVELPQQYASLPFLYQFSFSDSVDENQGNWGSLTNNILKTKSSNFLYKLYTDAPIPDLYVFGNTDSTFQYLVDVPGQTIDNPMGGSGVGYYIIRSNKFSTFSFIPPSATETKTYTTTMSFDYNNLIQIYAGEDNIPYSQDDIFVYAPNYWERLSITVVAN